MFASGRLLLSARHQHILVSGGLRGLAVALALALPEDLPQREAVVMVTFAVVAFSVFVKGFTMTPMLRRLGEIRSSKHGNRLQQFAHDDDN